MPDEEATLPPPPPPLPDSGAWTGGPPPPAVLIDPGQLRALRSLSVAVMALVFLATLINLASIPNDLAYINTLQDVVDKGFPDADDVEEIESQEDTRGTFGALTIVAVIAAGVVWIIWQQRARKCARALGGGGQRHTEPLAALGWFIPFANFVIPKQVTNDLWRASAPEGPAAMNIAGKPVWVGIDLWWGVWLLAGVLGRVLFRADQPATLGELDSYTSTLRVGLGATVLTVVAAGFAMVIVQRITERLLLRGQRHGITV